MVSRIEPSRLLTGQTGNREAVGEGLIFMTSGEPKSHSFLVLIKASNPTFARSLKILKIHNSKLLITGSLIFIVFTYS